MSVIGYQYGTAIGFSYQILIFKDIPNQYEIMGGILVTIACLLSPSEQLYQYYNLKNVAFQRVNDQDLSCLEKSEIDMSDTQSECVAFVE